LTLCNTSFLTRSVQLIFSILLQQHISKLYRYFWSTFRSVHVVAPSALPSYNYTLERHTLIAHALPPQNILLLTYVSRKRVSVLHPGGGGEIMVADSRSYEKSTEFVFKFVITTCQNFIYFSLTNITV
jgi:hypothetical protein